MPATFSECVHAVKRGNQDLVSATLYDAWKKRDPHFDNFDFKSTFTLHRILEGRTCQPECELITFNEAVTAFFAFVDHYVGEISHLAASRYLDFHNKSNYEWAREKFRDHLQNGGKLSDELNQCLTFAEREYDLKKSHLLAPKREPSTMSGVGSAVKNPNSWLDADHSESMRASANRSKRIK